MGSIATRVSGYSQWCRALVQSPDIAHLKVSFFGPFYGSYVVFELGEDYDYAFVSGFNQLFMVSRPNSSGERHVTRRVSETIAELGFDSANLIWLDKPAEVIAGNL